MIFSEPNQDKCLKFKVIISQTNGYVFYDNFDRLPSGNIFATQGRTFYLQFNYPSVL